MRMDVSLQQRLSQQLRLAPQIIQSIEILQLPLMDLRELQENELLEVEEAPRESLPSPSESPVRVDEEGTDDDSERVFDRLEGLLDADRARGRLSRSGGEEAADRKWEAMQNTAARGETLADHLHEQDRKSTRL